MDDNVQPIVQGESTTTDYWDSLNPAAVAVNHPEVRYNRDTDGLGELDTTNPTFKEYFDAGDGELKKAMLQSNNTSDAIKIAERRGIIRQANERIAQDGILTQLGMGILPALASPSSLLPLGFISKAAMVAKAASRIEKIAKIGAAGAITGGIANGVDETIFDTQGQKTHYMSAIGTGIVLGGGLGALTGALSGATKNIVAKNLIPENDSFSKDFEQDPNFTLTPDKNGILKLQEVAPMEKNFVDKIPFIGKILRSDIHTVLQSDNPTLRSFGLRISQGVLSSKDAEGNFVPIAKTGWDKKIELKGHSNLLVKNMKNLYTEAKKNGYKGNITKFYDDVWESYVKGVNDQRNKVYSEAIPKWKIKEEELLQAEKEETSPWKGDVAHYRTEEGKIEPLTSDIAGSYLANPDDIIYRPINSKIKKKKLKEIEEKYKEERDKAKEEIFNKYYEKHKESKYSEDTTIHSAAKEYETYFKDMLEEGRKLGVKELQHIHPNKLYAPRIYNYRKISKLARDEVYREVQAGLINDVRNKGMSSDELQEAIEYIIKMLDRSTFDTKFLHNSFAIKDLPLGQRLKQEKLYLNEAYMPNIVKHEANDIIGAYHYGMSGRYAVQHAFGTDQMKEVTDAMYKAGGNKASKEDVAAFDRALQDLSGYLRMNQLADTPAWSFTRNLLSYNSLRLGAGFGGNQVIETASTLMMSGVKAIITKGFGRALKDTAGLLFTGGKHSDFAEFLLASGKMEEALHSPRISRYGDTEQGFNSGWLETRLNDMNDTLMKYNGMRYFMGVMEDYAGGAVVTELKAGKIDEARLARWGLTKTQAKDLGEKLKEITKGNRWKVDKLSEIDRDRLQLAITRGIDEVVTQGDSIHLPAWFKAPSAFTKVLFQFMRFPLIAQETLMRRGMAEDKARMIGGTIASIGMYISLKYLREQAAISTGVMSPLDSKYDYEDFTSEDWQRVTMEALNYVAPLGMLATTINYGLVASGQPELDRDYAPHKIAPEFSGVSGGLAQDVSDIIKAAIDGDITDEKTLKKAQHLIPAYNAPLFKEGGQYLAEKYGD